MPVAHSYDWRYENSTRGDVKIAFPGALWDLKREDGPLKIYSNPSLFDSSGSQLFNIDVQIFSPDLAL